MDCTICTLGSSRGRGFSASRASASTGVHGFMGATPFLEGPLAGSDPVATGGWGCPAPSSRAPIEACRDGGSLPATAKERGSTSGLRWPWRNRKRGSNLHDRHRVRPNGDFVSGDSQSEPDTQDLPPPPALRRKTGLPKPVQTPCRMAVDHPSGGRVPEQILHLNEPVETALTTRSRPTAAQPRRS